MMGSDWEIKGTQLQPVITETLNALRIDEMNKGEFYTFVLNKYITAWQKGHIPRAYLGTADCHSTSIRIDKLTSERIDLIAEADGQSISTVIRTAFAWYIFRGKNKKDMWGSDEVYTLSRDGALP